ncbi:hypothetical protein Trydic_g22761 [Trypoxylus dichotomus]
MSSFRVLDEKYTKPSNLSQLLSELLPVVNGTVPDADVIIKIENKHHACKRKVHQSEHVTVECRNSESGLCEIFKKLRLNSEQPELEVKRVLHCTNCKLSNRGYCSVQRNFAGANKSLNVKEENLKLSRIPVKTSLNTNKGKTTPKSKIPVRVFGPAMSRNIKKNTSPNSSKSCLKSEKLSRYINEIVDAFPKTKRRVTFSEFVEDIDMKVSSLGRVYKKANRHLNQLSVTKRPPWRF